MELYKLETIKKDPFYEPSLRGIEMVKQFIAQNDAVIYGGTAIDYALRLVGDKIYPDDMLAVPDLDFFLEDSVNKAYELAQTFYDAGFESARAIKAQHIETMRVDVGDNHFIADISRAPAEVLRIIPTVSYGGMRCVHPDWQRVDLHSSLAFPYDNPPTEVIFARWKKDIERFNLLDKHYPIESLGGDTDGSLPRVELSAAVVARARALPGAVTGWLAFSLYESLLTGRRSAGATADDQIVADKSAADGAQIDGQPAAVSFAGDEVSVAYYEDFEAPAAFEGVMGLAPERLVGTVGGARLVGYSVKGRLLSVRRIAGWTVCSAQYLLMWFLMMHYMALGGFLETAIPAGVYKDYYVRLLEMVKSADAPPEFGLSIDVVGSENTNLSKIVQLSRDKAKLGIGAEIATPPNYYPARAKPMPRVDYADFPFLCEIGRPKN